MLQTPLINQHKNHNARLIEFAGWEMPVQYTSVIEESKAVRGACGLFDVSHMGRVWLRGEKAFEFLQHLTTNDIAKLGDNMAQYSMMCYEDGGTVDDIIVYRLPDEFLIVWNSSNRDKDMEWAKDHAKKFAPIEFEDVTFETAMIAVQGPTALGLVDLLSGQPLSIGERFSVQKAQINGVECVACRTGYTGEDGFELILPADRAGQVWDALISNGALPCGLASRDVLRVEAGLALYGHELSAEINPIEAGLGWAVSKTKEFIGSKAIAETREKGAKRKLVGVKMDSKLPPREGYGVFKGDQRIGVISSGVYSPMLERGIAFAFVDPAHSELDQPVSVEVRDKPQPATLVSKRFMKSREG